MVDELKRMEYELLPIEKKLIASIGLGIVLCSCSSG
jgi:hypothetical protein